VHRKVLGDSEGAKTGWQVEDDEMSFKAWEGRFGFLYMGTGNPAKCGLFGFVVVTCQSTDYNFWGVFWLPH
jgi:hypothetical protein